MPMPLGTRGVLTHQVRRVLMDGRFHGLDGAVQRRFAPSGQAVVGGDAHEQPVAPVQPELERVDAGNFHEMSMLSPACRARDRGRMKRFKNATIRYSRFCPLCGYFFWRCCNIAFDRSISRFGGAPGPNANSLPDRPP